MRLNERRSTLSAETRMVTRKGIHLNCNKTSGRFDLEFVLALSLAVRLMGRLRGVRIVVGRLRLEKLSCAANDVAIYWKLHLSRGKLYEVQI